MHASSVEVGIGRGVSLPLFGAETVPEIPRAFNPLRVMIFMLSRVALDPETTYRQFQDLEQGLVRLQFFGVSNPVPCFVASRSDADYQVMLDAIEENRRGPLGAAARRVIKWSGPLRQVQRLKREATVMTHFRDSLEWPVGDPFCGLSEAQQAENARLHGVLDEKRRQLRDLRITRMAALRRAAEPGVHSYYQLIEELQDYLARTLH